MVSADIKPGDKVAIFLPNCWEFGVAFHAAMLAGAVPTTLNPTYREREVRYQLENSDAVALITDGSLLTRNRSWRIAGVAEGLHGSHAGPERLGDIRHAL